MVSAIQFAVRDLAGGVQHGTVAGANKGNFIQVGSGDSVSLNLARSSVIGYEQQGKDLMIKLADGQTVVLSGYFNEAPGDTNHLYLSSEGQLTEVLVDDTGNGALFANYGPVMGWDKWSPLDDLRFADAGAIDPMAIASNEPAGMAPFVPGLLGGFGGLGTAAAVIGGAAVLGGMGGSGGKHIAPKVDPQATTTVTTNTVDPHLVVTGTGQPGEKVVVTIGGKTQETTIGTDGKWGVTFPVGQLPVDGNYHAAVVVTDAKGGLTNLTGPAFVLDLTPPDVSVTHGTKSTGDVENLQEYQNGVSIDGKGEPGATIKVQIGDHTQSTTVAADGNWSVTFTTSQIAAGEYEVPVKITATDPLGNQTVVNETLVIDTVPNPITFNAVTSDNMVNLTESQSGLVVTGTSTAGATMTITLQGVTQTATVGADGNWSVTYPVGTLPGGEYTASLTATTTDAAGNASSASHSFQVDTVANVGFTGAVAGDNTVNATEAAAGVQLTGTAQPGSTVTVEWNGTTLPATVAGNGTWSVTFPAGAIPAGTYSSTATVTATDAAGNSASATLPIAVDTETSVAINAIQAGDNVISGAEAQTGVSLNGTAEPGATVKVTFEGVTHTVIAASNGTWSSDFASSEIRTGSYGSTVSVTSTDLAGNTASATHAIKVDTEVNPFTRVSLSTGADNVLNKVEAADGLTVTGTVEPGSTVTVHFGNGQERPATVAANGTWTLTIPAGDIPAGENSVTLTAVARDAVGNVSTLTEQVAVDTVVRNFAVTSGTIGGDGILNASEVSNGLNLSGTSEPGSNLVVHMANGVEKTVVIGDNGLWNVSFSAAELPQGEVSSSVTFTATDHAGNVATLSQNFLVDTVAPMDPRITNDAGTDNVISGIATQATAGEYAFHAVAANGAATELTSTAHFEAPVSVNGSNVASEWNFFSNPVPDGSYLVISDTDTAGNQSSTLYIRSTTGDTVVDLSRSGLSEFDFGTIDLSASHSTLSLTESQIMSLTGADHSMAIKGGADDTVHLAGAVVAGHETINGDAYTLYTLGTNGASVLIDDDIHTTTNIV